MENYNLTLDDVKAKKGYKFTLTRDLHLLKEDFNNKDSECDVYAVLELPYIDIEWTVRAFNIHDYFCCVRTTDDWHSDDAIDFGEISPIELNTVEELEKDMFTQLLKYAKDNNLNLYSAN